MKTVTNQTTTYKCEEQQNYSLPYLLLCRLWQSLKSGMNSAYRAASAGLNAKQCLQYLMIHRRVTCGVVIILMAPLSLLAYTLFDSTVDDRTWYFTNMYWYVWTIGPYVCFGLWSIGAFLLFPTKSAFRYIAIVPVISFSTTIIIHFTFFVRDYETFHSHSLGEIVFGVSVALSILIASDYLIYRKYHLKDGNIARIFGIIDAPGIDPSKKLEIMKVLRAESENFYNRV